MIVAIVTAYKPGPGFVERFAPLLRLCGSVIVSDNTPPGHPQLTLPNGFALLRNGGNLGLGPALNRGLAEARRQGAATVILFDQDSSPSEEFVRAMVDRLGAAITELGPKVCIGPTHVDDRVDGGAPVTQAPTRQAISCLPTSGMVFKLTELAHDELFAEDLFLDLVDFEWCWRLGRSGWRFARVGDVHMPHRLGEAQRQCCGLTYHVPAPYRHYFQVRDTMRLALRPYVPLYAKLRLLGVLPIKAVVYPFTLDSGRERLRWMLRGAVDAMRGVTGIGAAGTRLAR